MVRFLAFISRPKTTKNQKILKKTMGFLTYVSMEKT